jgi:hypothetical protein
VITGNTQFEYELRKLIDVEIDRIKDILAMGKAIPDFAEYRYHVGQLDALGRVADSYCEETNSIISKR